MDPHVAAHTWRLYRIQIHAHTAEVRYDLRVAARNSKTQGSPTADYVCMQVGFGVAPVFLVRLGSAELVSFLQAEFEFESYGSA
jgi:hypothetical protein